ncbi:hypothetical protein [Effusibacillus lacus]|uniref:Uncharacterized protein n=1 Tax=Effusibacillus lacus TaxID=1348429 RepID=A0A292YS09_9BACL|nr:hypothetical protein [Effusibacillus lacus]TCS75910.1 hypothetical protein EDD64_10592 [Effusibacillus lacus]GAX91701.1 hypothetical protein EFBL_3391 [Effusibacillus lacus]
MPHNDYLLRHIHTHHDPFVRDLFKELDQRITMMEEGDDGTFVERMKLADAVFPVLVTVFIIVMFVITIANHT